MTVPEPDTAFADVQRYCMFFGYPRSGHTLVGSLLNAHPEMLVSHELDALSLVREGIDQRGLFNAILAEERRFAARDRWWTDYDYSVSDAWHGRWERLVVIGDKKGGRSSWWLNDEPQLFEKLYETVKLPVRFIHVTRSPWDNIATIARRGHSHDEAITWYLDTCKAVRGIKARIPASDVLDLRHEDLVADPRTQLRTLAGFLGVDARMQWLDACVARISRKPNRSRFELAWTSEQLERVREGIAAFEWFRPEDRLFEVVAA